MRRFTALTVTAGLAIAIAVSTGGAAPARTPSAASPSQSLTKAIESDLDAHPDIPGEAVSIRSPKLDVAAAQGYADIADKRPLRTDTPFRIASVTKTFVAVAVLRLVEQGKVALDTPISQYLSPDTVTLLTRGGYRPEQIAVQELLDHTSGLFDYATSDAYDEENVDNPGRKWTRAEQLQFAIDHGKPIAAPGDEYHYSDTNYVLLGEILERTTGQPLAQAVRNEVGFDRIGLGRTYWEVLEPTPAFQAERAHQYYDRTFDNITLDASSDLYGGGGLISTVGDLTLFYRALFDGKVFDSDATLGAMLTVSRPGRQAGAGLGIFAMKVAGQRCWGHPGYWGTVAAYCPKLAFAYAIATNQANEAKLDTRPLERTIVSLAK